MSWEENTTQAIENLLIYASAKGLIETVDMPYFRNLLLDAFQLDAPAGDIVPMTAECPTLTFNTIGRHQSRLVRTRISSNLSPWLSQCSLDDPYTVAISHGEGRFVANDEVLAQLIANGQVATQYVGEDGKPSMDLSVNPNGSVLAIEGITSPDGRVLGKMGHAERRGDNLYRNVPEHVPGDKFMPIFESGVAYFA